jgi:hypothetical protein
MFSFITSGTNGRWHPNQPKNVCAKPQAGQRNVAITNGKGNEDTMDS